MNNKTITAKVKTNIRKFIKSYNNSRGWLLIMLVFLFGLLAAGAIMKPLSVTTVQLYDTVFEQDIRRTQRILLTTNSPIRNYVVDELYGRIQQQLKDHLAKAAGSSNYMCQNTEVPPSSNGSPDSKLENQFGLCSPERLFEGMDGNTNQSIDFNTAFGLKLHSGLSESDTNLIKKLMKQNENSYDYTLRTIFVRQELLEYGGVGKKRRELYHWLTRADVIATTNSVVKGDIRQPLVIYYDVYLTNEFYPNTFYGAGTACQKQPSIVIPCFSTDGLGIGLSCSPVTVTTSDGATFHGDETTTFDLTPTGPCFPEFGFIQTCPIEGGGTVTRVKLPIKPALPQFGCASLNSGSNVRSRTVPDPKGYSFILTVKTVSIGASYN